MKDDSETTKAKARPRIVVADDEASARSGLGTLLRDEGFEVILAEDGPTALSCVQESNPDILVTDLRMPGMDGIELLRKAREVDPELVVVAHDRLRRGRDGRAGDAGGRRALPDQAAPD